MTYSIAWRRSSAWPRSSTRRLRMHITCDIEYLASPRRALLHDEFHSSDITNARQRNCFHLVCLLMPSFVARASNPSTVGCLLECAPIYLVYIRFLDKGPLRRPQVWTAYSIPKSEVRVHWPFPKGMLCLESHQFGVWADMPHKSHGQNSSERDHRGAEWDPYWRATRPYVRCFDQSSSIGVLGMGASEVKGGSGREQYGFWSPTPQTWGRYVFWGTWYKCKYSGCQHFKV